MMVPLYITDEWAHLVQEVLSLSSGAFLLELGAPLGSSLFLLSPPHATREKQKQSRNISKRSIPSREKRRLPNHTLPKV